jgi:L-glutamine-phosphate cytidylyltransferase
MKAIILAAGRGSRMGSLTDNLPKCRTRFFGKELIEWQLDALTHEKINEKAIITGYLSNTFKFDVQYFRNPDWAISNMVRTLTYAADWSKESTTIISYSDIVYSPLAIDLFVNSNEGTDISLLYDPDWRNLWELRFENPLDDAETFTHTNGILTGIGEKTDSIDKIQGQFMGLIKITPRGWILLQEYLNNLTIEEINKLDCTSLIKNLLKMGVQIGLTPIKDQWFELDSEEDLNLYLKHAHKNDIFKKLI